MSGGLNKQFLSNVRNFLSQNVIDVALADRTGLGPMERVLTVDLRLSMWGGAKAADGSPIPLVEVAEVGSSGPLSQSHRFQAYYLQYRSNAVRTTRLSPSNFGGASADIFFTDTLNGCSFACGPGVMPKVGHFNRTVGGVDGAPIDQTAVDADIGFEFGMGTRLTVKKADYRADVTDYATILGVRSGGGWDFWLQKKKIAGMRSPTEAEQQKGLKQGYIWQLDSNAPERLT